MDSLWVWAGFVFVVGCCIGSFLNVVIWRLPRGGSVWRPAGSQCPHCGRPIAWFDNIPLLSWLVLRAACRQCGGRISVRYPLIELATGLLLAGLFLAYALADRRPTVLGHLGVWPANWPGLLAAGVLMSCLLAASVIDLEHFIIPVPAVWVGGLVGVLVATIFPGGADGRGGLVGVSGSAAAWGIGGGVGLLAAMALLYFGVIPTSFPEEGEAAAPRLAGQPTGGKESRRARKKRRRDREKLAARQAARPPANDGQPTPAGRRAAPSERRSIGATVGARREVSKELLFLAPVIVGAWAFWRLTGPGGWLGEPWRQWSQSPHLLGLAGSLWGLLVGGGIVWAVRVIGTLIAGREAMGLGDVHVLAAAGAVVGWAGAVLAFFMAACLGAAFGVVRVVRGRGREIPLGPYLGLGVLAVLLTYRWWADRLGPGLGAIFGGGG